MIDNYLDLVVVLSLRVAIVEELTASSYVHVNSYRVVQEVLPSTLHDDLTRPEFGELGGG